MIFQYVNGDNSRYQIYTFIEFQSFLANQGIAYGGRMLGKIIGGAINYLRDITRLAAVVQRNSLDLICLHSEQLGDIIVEMYGLRLVQGSS